MNFLVLYIVILLSPTKNPNPNTTVEHDIDMFRKIITFVILFV